MAADPTMQPTVLQRRQSGANAIPTGGSLDIESGGALKIAGTDVTTYLAALPTKGTGTAYDTVAAAGTNQATAGAVPSADFVVVTAGDGTKGVVLPTPAAGRQILVKNNAGSILKVYPASGGTINALSADAAISMAANTCAIFAASSATQWWTCPLLPS